MSILPVVSLENLFGTPAQGRRVRGPADLAAGLPAVLPTTPGFVFTDPFRDPEVSPRSVTIELAEGRDRRRRHRPSAVRPQSIRQRHLPPSG